MTNDILKVILAGEGGHIGKIVITCFDLTFNINTH